jgi:hypothetical protein
MMYEQDEKPIKPFFLFAGASNYPGGGMRDFIASFETKEEAEEFEQVTNVKDGPFLKWDWFQIVDVRKLFGEIDPDFDIRTHNPNWR